MNEILAASMPLEQSLCYNLPAVQLFVVCVVLPMILSLIGLWMSRKLIPSHFLNQSHDVTGPFFSTLGTVYGIFLAFVVSTTWQQFSNTQSNLVQEARYLSNLYFATKAFSSPMQEQLQQLLREYRDSVVNEEWKSMSKGKENPQTTLLVDQIGRAYMGYKTTDPTENSFLHESIQNLSSLKGLRASRIDDANSGLIGVLWFVLLVGAVATIGFSFLFGAHNFKAQAVMTMLLTGVISMTFFTIINLDFPFTGTTTVSPEPLQSLQMK
jgi:ABC-type multidrug transport system fused ATPase/permease subunit